MEKWEMLKGYESLYEISDQGQVKSLLSNRMLKHTMNNGRPMVTIKYKDGYKGKFVSRLVAETFIDNSENKKYVKHLDGDNNNNVVSNLCWTNGRTGGVNTFIYMRDYETQEEIQIWKSVRSISVWFRTNKPYAKFNVKDFNGMLLSNKKFSMYGYSWEILR